MFNKRMIYMAPPTEVPRETVGNGAAEAKNKLEEFMPKAEQLKAPEVELQANSIDQEKVRTDEIARADIIAVAKFAKKFDAKVPGVDNELLKQVTATLKQVPADHFATKRMEAEIDDKTYYFVSIYDGTKKAPAMFYTTAQLDPENRTFLRDVDDSTYKKLTGKDREKKAV